MAKIHIERMMHRNSIAVTGESAASYALMGVVNPVLQEKVDWPWFIVSQFIFGLVAAIVVVRSEMVHIPPAGRGPDR